MPAYAKIRIEAKSSRYVRARPASVNRRAFPQEMLWIMRHKRGHQTRRPPLRSWSRPPPSCEIFQIKIQFDGPLLSFLFLEFIFASLELGQFFLRRL